MYIVSRIIMHTNIIAYNFANELSAGYFSNVEGHENDVTALDYERFDHETIITECDELINFFDHCDAQHPDKPIRYEFKFDESLNPS